MTNYKPVNPWDMDIHSGKKKKKKKKHKLKTISEVSSVTRFKGIILGK